MVAVLHTEVGMAAVRSAIFVSPGAIMGPYGEHLNLGERYSKHLRYAHIVSEAPDVYDEKVGEDVKHFLESMFNVRLIDVDEEHPSNIDYVVVYLDGLCTRIAEKLAEIMPAEKLIILRSPTHREGEVSNLLEEFIETGYITRPQSASA